MKCGLSIWNGCVGCGCAMGGWCVVHWMGDGVVV